MMRRTFLSRFSFRMLAKQRQHCDEARSNEKKAVETVHHPAVTRKNISRVFDITGALYIGLEEIPHGCHDGRHDRKDASFQKIKAGTEGNKNS